jgi:hypothetical protein
VAMAEVRYQPMMVRGGAIWMVLEAIWRGG